MLLFVIKNDQGANNIRLVIALIDLNKNEDQFINLVLDAEKAFNKIYSQYMFAY